MYQDKEYIDLSQLGYADIYIFTIDGKIYNKKTQKELKLYKHTYKLKCADGYYRTVSLKTYIDRHLIKNIVQIIQRIQIMKYGIIQRILIIFIQSAHRAE